VKQDLEIRLLSARESLGAAPLSLSEVAREACVSPFHFHRSFTKLFGQTPFEYALQQRIVKARQMLLETDRPVSHIAIELGFGTPGRFATAFQSEVGCTPSAFRRESRRCWSVSGWRTYAFVPSCFFSPRF
jgi:AraC-like DNA-binding protein